MDSAMHQAGPCPLCHRCIQAPSKACPTLHGPECVQAAAFHQSCSSPAASRALPPCLLFRCVANQLNADRQTVAQVCPTIHGPTRHVCLAMLWMEDQWHAHLPCCACPCSCTCPCPCLQEAMQGMSAEPSGCMDGGCGAQCPGGYVPTSFTPCAEVSGWMHASSHGAGLCT